MKKKITKLHFKQIPLKDVETLLQNKRKGSANDAELSVERPTLKTEPYSIPLAVNGKTFR